MQEHNWVRKGNGYICSPDKTSPRMINYYNEDACCGCGASMSSHLLGVSGYLYQSGNLYWILNAAWAHRGDYHDFIILVEEANAGS